MRQVQRRKLAVLLLVASAAIGTGCKSGPPVIVAPSDISRQPQAELAEQIERAMKFGDDALVNLILECVSIDAENDALAERDTPVLED